MRYALGLPRDAANGYHGNDDADWLALLALLVAADEVIECDPDAAALLLDGLLERMLGAWYVARGWRVPARGALLADLDQRAPELARRVRLALRAPDVAARLAHHRQVARVLAAAWGDGAEVLWGAALARERRQGARNIQRLSALDVEGWQAKGGVEHVR